MNGKVFLKIAHRGFSERYSENTMLAFAKAVEHGADMIELDVQLTSDGSVVVIHDERVDRTSNGKGVVREMTLKEMKEMNFGFMEKFREAGQTIPTLEETIGKIKGKALLNIEIKKNPLFPDYLEEALTDLLEAMNSTGDVIVSSFDHYALMRIRELNEEIRTGMICDAVWMSFQYEMIELNAYSVHPSLSHVNWEQMRWAAESGYKVYPWVARTGAEVEQVRRSGLADGLMVNDLALFSEAGGAGRRVN